MVSDILSLIGSVADSVDENNPGWGGCSECPKDTAQSSLAPNQLKHAIALEIHMDTVRHVLKCFYKYNIPKGVAGTSDPVQSISDSSIIHYHNRTIQSTCICVKPGRIPD